MSDAGTRIGTLLFALLVVGSAAAGAAGAAGGTASAAAGGQPEVTLTVTVVDRGGNPLDGARITATWGDGGGPRNATTASNGKAFVDVPEGADVTLRVDRRFYARNEPHLVENASEREVTVEMAREGQATVVVRDANGRVDDAVVRLFQDGQPVVGGRTGPDGTFATGPLEQDEYALVAFSEGYRRNRTTLTVDGTVRATATIEQDSVLVTFGVRDDHFQPARPVVDANVTIPGVADVTTQGNGRVTVSLPVNDAYDVEITKPGYGTSTDTIEVGESRHSLNATIQRIPGLSVSTGVRRVVVGENVSVRVTDEYGEREVGATVSLDGTEVGRTNDEGVLEVPVETPGNHTVEVSSGDLVARATVEGVRPAAADTATPSPTATATPTAAPTATATQPPTSGIGPGFGLLPGLLALLLLAAVVGRRR